MGLYLMFGKYGPGSLGKVSAERTVQAAELIQENGGTLKEGYAVLGDSDLLLVVDFPDTGSVVKASAALGNMLGVSFSTSGAVTIAEFDRLLGK